MNQKSIVRTRAFGIWCLSLLALVAIAFVLWLVWPKVVLFVYELVRVVWIPVLVMLAIAGVGVAASFWIRAMRKSRGGSSYYYHDDLPAWPIVVMSIAGLLSLIPMGMLQSYASSHRISQTVTVMKESPDELQFRDRSPFDIASATSRGVFGDTIGEGMTPVRALPAYDVDDPESRGAYSTTLIERGFLKGYKATAEMRLPEFGTADPNKVTTTCDWDTEKAGLRFGGAMPVNSFERAAMHAAPFGAYPMKSDAVFVCEPIDEADPSKGLKPVLYAPMVRLTGFFGQVPTPSGVVVYDGLSGELEYHESYEDPELPLYPTSVAKRQRESTTASGSFADWVFNRVGWEDTGKDSGDPNGANRAEFGLKLEAPLDGRRAGQVYVTPLNTRGESRSIVGIGEVDAASVEKDAFAEYRVRLYPKGSIRQPNSAVEDRITGELLQGYQAQGLSVFEVVPQDGSTWVATLGRDQSILYRAFIDGTGSIELVDSKGRSIGSVSADGEPSLPQGGDEDEGSTPSQGSSAEVGSLSNEELVEMARLVAEELARRAS